MNLTLIDNSFYKLTLQQASQLCVEQVLPKHGYERKADLTKLAGVKFGKRIGLEYPKNEIKYFWKEFEHCQAIDVKSAWVTRTPLSYWQGKPIENGWTWALHVIWH